MLNLLLNFGGMGSLLLAQLRAHAATSDDARTADGSLLDAFLFAAGLNQIVEDHLHRDVCSLDKAARHLPSLAGVHAGRFAAAGAIGVQGAASELRSRLPGERALIAWQAELAVLVRDLADAVAGELTGTAAEPRARALVVAAEALMEPVTTFPPALRGSVVRLAHCFRSFDQRPEDCRRMVNLLISRFPDRERLRVVGLRTSGSYLAPLCAAFLTSRGFDDVEVTTLRPGQRWLRHEVAGAARSVREDRLVCLVDDPPRSGTQLAQAAEAFLRAGIARRSLVLLIPLFGPAASLPPVLGQYQTVVLPWSEWSIHEDLAPTAVEETLSRALVGRRIRRSPGPGDGADLLVRAVRDVRVMGPSATTTPPERGHVSARFGATLVDGTSGEHVDHEVHVKGVGLGYLGAHSLAVARPLSDYTPAVYAVDNGLLYRAWLPDEWRITGRADLDTTRTARGIAAYVAVRRRALAVPEDVSERLVGRGAVWDLVADMLSDAFGRAKYAVRPLASPTARRRVRPSEPSIVDGNMSLAHWYAAPGEAAPNGVLKTGFDARAFSNEDSYCYDAVFDLASVAADASTQADGSRNAFGERLRLEFERSAGEHVPDERWLLYQLLYHHRIGQRLDRRLLPARLMRETAMAHAYRRYIAERYFADLTPPSHGPLCAIDVDWVLETRWLSFPAISPAGALALRALAQHGFRPVIATGRSLADVQARCADYRLAGGVAEYGAAAYDHRSDRAWSLLSEADKADLESLRAILEQEPGVSLDPRYEHAIRAYGVDADGRASRLAPEVVKSALMRTGVPMRFSVIATESQTDFALAHVDKGTGLRALARELAGRGDAPAEPILALAVGDSSNDLPMLRLAGRAFAPSNADPALRQSAQDGSAHVEVVRRPCQAGLLRAVSSFLGHAPRRCPLCAPSAPLDPEARVLLSMLGALDGGAREKAKKACSLAISELVNG
jgi:hydroxymethylpyrimidine pyrophosphatase-like HAD family hydrolase